MRKPAAWLLFITFIFASVSVHAQFRNWLDQLEGLTEKDTELMKQTAREGMDGKKEGARLTWTNPESGNRGIVELLEIRRSDAQECRRNKHIFEYGADKKRSSVEALICRKPGGEWQIVG